MPANLWPARLHHLRRDSPEPERLARFYGELLGDQVEPLADGSWLVAGRARRLVVGRGAAGSVPYIAFEMQDREHLGAFKLGMKSEPSPTPLFEDGAFAVRDPDGRQVVFGIAKAADACADAGNADRGVKVALDIEQLISDANRLLDAATLINRLRKEE